jgi:hypothetical protein
VVWAGTEHYHSPGSTFRIGVEPSNAACGCSERSTITVLRGGHVFVSTLGGGARTPVTREVVGGETATTVAGEIKVVADPEADSQLGDALLLMQEVPPVELEAGPTCRRRAPEDCVALGVVLESAEPVDVVGARSMYADGCVYGSVEACRSLARLAWAGWSPDQTELETTRVDPAHKAACRLDAPACIKLGWRTLVAASPSVERWAIRAVERACDATPGAPFQPCPQEYQDAPSIADAVGRCSVSTSECPSLGYQYGVDGQGGMLRPSIAAYLYRDACEAGNATACTNLGVLYAQGRGVTKDVGRARELYEQGCDDGNATGCVNLGVLYEDGRGVAKDVGVDPVWWTPYRFREGGPLCRDPAHHTPPNSAPR